MTGTTNDGAGRRPRPRPRADASPPPPPAPPAVPSQRAAGGRVPADEVVVRLDASDESLDRVVAGAREAQAAGVVLHLVAVPEPRRPGAAGVARDRLAHRLDMAAEVARALCPGLPVEVTGPGDGDD